jgi:hypothetical protein
MPISLNAVRALAAEVVRPAHFFIAPALRLDWEHLPEEELVWEVFRGRLLDPAHSRQRCVFESWNIYQFGPEGRGGEPLLALKLDANARQLHVLRSLDSYVWEGYDAGGNVILSRQRRKWVRELAGTLELDDFASVEELRNELTARLLVAVVGVRLPLSSLESPLPGFSFGELFYCYRPDAQEGEPARSSVPEVVDTMLPAARGFKERARLLELLLRATSAEDLPRVTQRFSAPRGAPSPAAAPAGAPLDNLPALLRTLFNEVSLSPYTDFTDRVLQFLHLAEEDAFLTPDQAIDFLGYLLRQLGRHLTAYDLVTFHHRGANYPDALLLDAVLRDYLARIEQKPERFLDRPHEGEGERHSKRLRRRALRQGWLLRRCYEGHPVPALPTSPGENSRVLPPGYPRIDEEEILQPARRTRRLYEGDPLPSHLGLRAAEVLRHSVADLAHPAECRELGAAVFLDRPLGVGKAPGEPDATLLLSSVACSRSIAEQRLDRLLRDLDLPAAHLEPIRAQLTLAGLPLDAIGEPARPGTLSLSDARRAAPDFVFLHTTHGSVNALLEQFDFGPLGERIPVEQWRTSHVLIDRSPIRPGLVVYDESLRPVVELEVQTAGGYVCRGGQEVPRDGLLVVQVWSEEAGTWQGRDVRDEGIRLRPARQPGGSSWNT